MCWLVVSSACCDNAMFMYCFTAVFRDQFVLYEDGYGNHVGRLKEMIIRGGENLFPKEIEYFLESHPSISQVQVIIYMHILRLLSI